MVKLFRRRLYSRRRALILGLSALTAPMALSVGKSQAIDRLIITANNALTSTSRSNQKRQFTVVGKNSLKQRAKAKGLIYGAFPEADNRKFEIDPALQSLFVRECAMMTVGCYWVISRPSVSTFDFTASDYFVKFATKHKLRLHGHPLVWHDALAPWVAETLNRTNTERILTEHIQTIVRRYAGKIHSWDVLNEGIDVGAGGGGRADGIKDTLWLKFLGVDYIDLAFRVAAKADPRAKLVYNDYGVEYDTPEDDAKREAILNLLQRLKAQGTPIYALGIQSHLSVNTHRFNPTKFREFLRSVAKLGLKIMITELDVTDRNLPLDTALRDRLIAAMYEDYLTTALDERAVVSVTTWGLSDRYSWLAQDKPRPDRAPVRPLPFDRNLQPKLAWKAIARAFDRAPKRRSN
jgi:endo-1,4-beta-xylanase